MQLGVICGPEDTIPATSALPCTKKLFTPYVSVTMEKLREHMQRIFFRFKGKAGPHISSSYSDTNHDLDLLARAEIIFSIDMWELLTHVNIW